MSDDELYFEDDGDRESDEEYLDDVEPCSDGGGDSETTDIYEYDQPEAESAHMDVDAGRQHVFTPRVRDL